MQTETLFLQSRTGRSAFAKTCDSASLVAWINTMVGQRSHDHICHLVYVHVSTWLREATALDLMRDMLSDKRTTADWSGHTCSSPYGTFKITLAWSHFELISHMHSTAWNSCAFSGLTWCLKCSDPNKKAAPHCGLCLQRAVTQIIMYSMQNYTIVGGSIIRETFAFIQTSTMKTKQSVTVVTWLFHCHKRTCFRVVDSYDRGITCHVLYMLLMWKHLSDIWNPVCHIMFFKS